MAALKAATASEMNERRWWNRERAAPIGAATASEKNERCWRNTKTGGSDWSRPFLLVLSPVPEWFR